MVAVEKIKNSDIAYERFGDVVLLNSNTSVALNHINSFNESDLEIEIETYFPVEELKRGWVGDMYYEVTHGMSVDTNKYVGSKYNKCIKDVLLARVNSYKDGPECVAFTYTFLKY